MARYSKSLSDLVGIDRALFILRALPWAIVGGGVIGAIAGGAGAAKVGLPLVLGMAVGFVGGTLLAYLAAAAIVGGGSALVLRTLQPRGDTTPYAHDFSQIEAFVVRGEFDAAAVLWEDAVVERPGDVDVRVRAGDFFAGPGGNPARARTLFREVQQIAGAPPERVLYVSQRLVDLHLGPLADKGRAVVELRRIIERWPNSAAARHGREALARLKAELHDTDGPSAQP